MVRVLDAAGESVDGSQIVVHWSRNGQLGSDAGMTDAEGRYKTSLRFRYEFRSVSVGELTYAGGVDPHPQRPRELLFQMPDRGRITGRLFDNEGHAVVGVAVRLDQVPTLSAIPWRHLLRQQAGPTVRTDAEGRFAIETVAGIHELRASSDDHLSPYGYRVHVQPGSVLYLPLELTPLEGELEITVSVPPDVPAWPYLWLERVAQPSTPKGPGVVLFSDEQAISADVIEETVGQFRFSVRLPREALDNWLFHASMESCNEESLTLEELIESPEVTFARTEPQPVPRTLEVQVRTVTGEGLQAEIQLSYDELDDGSSSPTDENGVYQTGVYAKEGNLYLRVQAEGYERAFVGPIDLGPELPKVEATLAPAFPIRGTCVTPEGKRVKCWMSLYRPRSLMRDAQGNPSLETGPGFLDVTFSNADNHETDSWGNFLFEAAEDTEVKLWVRPYDDDLPPAQVVARGGETLRVVLGTGIEDRVELDGLVLDALTGDPVVAYVSLQDMTEHGRTYDCWSDAEGRALHVGLPPGKYEVDVQAYGYAMHEAEVELRQSSTEPHVFRIWPARTVHVHVIDAQGEPFEGEVSAHDSSGHALGLESLGWPWWGVTESLDPAGRAVLRGLPATSITLRIGWNDLSDPVEYGPHDWRLDGVPPGPHEHRLDLTKVIEGIVEIRLPE